MEGAAGRDAEGVYGGKVPFGAGGRGMLFPIMGTAMSSTASM